MNNKTNRNFSLRKLLLTALIAGPLATLPAPLWALPSVAAANLTTTAGVTAVAVSATAINVTSPDKGVLTWGEFGNGASPINAADTINYFLPSTTSSVLNVVSPSGAQSTAASTIAGTIASNGNVYILNPNGIILSSTAQVNTGGFWASTVNEPLAGAGFALNGTLSFTGTSSSAVTVNGASFQSIGTGNNVVLWGRNVNVNSATVYGNLKVNAVGGAGQNVTFAGASLANPGAVNINKVGSPAAGGDLIINSNGGDVILSGIGTSGSGTAVQAVTTTVGGPVTSIGVGSTGGTGYAPSTSIPVIVGGAPAGGVTARAVANTDATGTITSFTLINGGSGYTSVPSVTIPSPGAAFPTLTANVGTTINPTTMTLTAIAAPTGVGGGNVGSYPANTVISASVVGGLAPGGTAATATATVGATGQITGYTIVTPGSGYVTEPVVTVGNPSLFTVTAAGNLTINTGSNTTGAVGNVSQLSNANVVTANAVTVSSSATLAGTTTYGSINLPSVEFGTLTIPAAGSAVVTDTTGGLILGNTNIYSATTGTVLNINAGATNAGALTMSSGAKIQVVPTASNNPQISLQGSSITMTGTGVLTFSGLTTSTSSGAVTITGDNNVLIGATGTGGFTGKQLTITTTGGTISMGALNTTSAGATLVSNGDITIGAVNTSGAVSAKSSAGKATVGAFNAAGASTVTSVGDITFSGNIGAPGGITVASSAGSISVAGAVSASGSFTAANNLSIATATLASSAAIDRGTLNVPTSNNSVIGNAPSPTTGSITGGFGVTNSGAGYTPNTTLTLAINGTGTAVYTTNGFGQISGTTVVTPGGAYTANPTVNTIPVPTNAIVAGGALALTATSGSISIGGPVISTTTGALSLTSGQNIALPLTTAPTLSVKSTGGNITQTAAVTSTSLATLDASTDITLNNTSNNFSTVVLLNAGAGSTGVSLTDVNDIIIGNGTNAKGAVSITSGAGIATLAASSAAITQASLISGAIGTTATSLGGLTGPNSLPILRGATNGVAGLVTLVTVINAGSGYPASVTTLAGASAVTISAAPNAGGTALPNITTLATGGVAATASTQFSNGGTTQTSGFTLNAIGQITGVTLLFPIGNGFTPNSSFVIPSTALGTPVPAAGGGIGFYDSALLGTGAGATALAFVNGDGQISRIQMTNIGTAGFPYMIPAIAFGAIGTATGGTAGVTETGAFINTSSTGTVSNVSLTGNGAGYFGAYGATATIVTPPTAAAATFLGNTNATGALTSLTVTPNSQAAGYGYTGNPTLNVLSTNGVKLTAVATNGVLTSVTPVYTGGIALGSAATDSLTFNSGLTLTTSSGTATSPAGASTALPLVPYSEVSTVANNVFVSGNVTLNTNGTNATLGLNTIAGVGKFSFGSINAALGAGNLTVNETTTLNLGTIAAANVTANSIGGDIVNSGPITVTGAGVLTVVANSIFSPGNVTLSNTGNRIDNVTIQNANNFTLVDTPAAAAVNVVAGNTLSGKAVVGSTNVNVLSGKNAILTATGGGDYNTVGFTMSGGNFTITDPNTVTIANATNTAAGTVSVTAQTINLGSGIALNSTGLSTFATSANTSTVTTSITDSSPNISIFGPSSFTSNGTISITKAGHSFGPVSLVTTGTQGGALLPVATNITYTEAGTANLNVVGVNTSGAGLNGTLTVTSTSGGIKQTAGTGVITVPVGAVVLPVVANSAVFTAATNVLIDNTGTAGNIIAAPVSVRATTDSSVVQGAAAANNLSLASISVTGGGFTATTSLSAGATITQNATTPLFVYGASAFRTNAGAITLTTPGNNFGGLTLLSNNTTLTGAPISIVEGGTMNLVNVNTGTAITSSFTATSSGAGIIESSNPGITVGGTTTLTAQAAGITLNTGNLFGGANGILLTTAGNVAIQDGSATTVLASGTNIGGTLTVRNTANGTLLDAGGNLTVAGNVLFDVGTGNIGISGAGNAFGAVQFRAATVSIAENTTMNLTAGSVASGSVQLSSNANIITSGLGTSLFSGPTSSLSLNAGGSITISNPIFVANTLTFRALGAVDLSALSLIGNLNGKTPVNLGAASVKDPTP